MYDLLDDDLEDLERTFSLFFGKENIVSGRAEDQAGKYLLLTNKQRAIQDLLPQARRLVQSPPYPSLPQAIMELAKQKGFILSETEATELLARMPEPPTPAPSLQPSPAPHGGRVTVTPPKSETSNNGISSLNPDNPGDLRFTRVEGTIGGNSAKGWKELVDIGIRLALQNGYDVRTLNSYLPVNIKDGIYTEEGYSRIEGFNVSMQGMSANNAAKTLVLLAKKLNCNLKLVVSWRDKSPSPGKKAVIQWPS